MADAAILLMSDNPLTTRLVCTALGGHGYDLITAHDLPTAWELSRTRAPALVLEDMLGDGAQRSALTAALRARMGAGVPLLAFTGFAATLDARQMQASGVSGTIAKPLEPRRLRQIVRAHLFEQRRSDVCWGEGRRLILADPDAGRRGWLQLRLQRLGFEVWGAADGSEASELARARDPVAIVSDFMLPALDRLDVALRSDAATAQLPLLLISQVEPDETERGLARRLGRTELVTLDCDAAALQSALRSVLARQPALASRSAAASASGEELAHVHERLVARQLERQVALNTVLGRRCAALAAELRVLAGLSERLLAPRELEPALDEALLSCFDAGGIRLSALYLGDGSANLKLRAVSGHPAVGEDALRDFFGHPDLLRSSMQARLPARIPSADVPDTSARAVLDACGAEAMIVLPLAAVERTYGALLIAGERAVLEGADLLTFAEGLACQITHTLELLDAFEQESRARDHAERQAALLSALLLNAPDSVAHISRDGTLLFLNRVLRDAQPSLTLGQSWLTVHSPEQRAQAQVAFDAVIATGQPKSYEASKTLPDGGARWWSNRLGPVRRNGEIVGALLIARDITEQKQSGAQLLVADRMASVGMLAASVAHEINNPLAAVMINLELLGRDLKRGASGDRLALEVDGALEGTKRVSQVVRDLKIFSRTDDNVTRFRVRPVLESSLRIAWNEIRHRARLVTHYDTTPAVDGVESRLGQVFLNLIMNAVHAMPEGQRERNELRVHVGLDGRGWVLVRITDTGCGIAPEQRARLFEPFHTTKPVGVGTGLGLSICDRIVRSMDGEIGFDSEVGVGTTFWVALPPTGRASIPVGPPAVHVSAPPRRGRVLIVEDDRLFGNVIKGLLSREHDTVLLDNAELALQLVCREPCFDVILCDLMMPQMSGQVLYRELRRLQPEQAARMVFVTGGPFTPSAREFLTSVPNRRLDKPFAPDALRRTIHEVFDERAAAPRVDAGA